MGWMVRLIPTFFIFILILITFNRLDELLVSDRVTPYPGLLVVFRLYSVLLPPSVACL